MGIRIKGRRTLVGFYVFRRWISGRSFTFLDFVRARMQSLVFCWRMLIFYFCIVRNVFIVQIVVVKKLNIYRKQVQLVFRYSSYLRGFWVGFVLEFMLLCAVFFSVFLVFSFFECLVIRLGLSLQLYDLYKVLFDLKIV